MLWFVPVKHYIAQSGEFVLCAFGSLHIALNAVKIKRHLTGLVFAGLALAFLINVFYVATSRTQLVVFPCLLVVFGIQRFGLRGAYVALATGAILASLVWFTSPYLRGRVIGVVQAIHHSQAGDPPASADDSLISAAQHLSILKRSIQIIEKAPLIGNGTGSITELFRQSAAGKTGARTHRHPSYDLLSAMPHINLCKATAINSRSKISLSEGLAQAYADFLATGGRVAP